MNDAGAGPRAELDLEALARGDRVAAEALVDGCRGDRVYVLEPDVFAALMTLSTTRSLARQWEALQAQLRSVRVDVPALRRALKAADEVKDDDDDDEEGDNKGDTIAERLLTIADQYEYFCNEFGLTYMTVELPIEGGGSRSETIKIQARKARLFFVHQYMLAYGKPPGREALRGVIEALEARAAHGGAVHPVYIRHARHNGKIYLDRGTEDGSAYEIDGAGVRIVPRPPVRFLRPAGMLPLVDAVFVDPKEGLRRLTDLTLFRNERDSVLTTGFMLDALGGEGPYSVLLIIGEGGAAKSTLAKMIVALVDPRLLPLLNPPASKRDLYISASTRALVAYNNLSYLDKSISDGLWTATEGGAESRRSLYTDDDESSVHAKAPFILVAIDNVLTRGDLASRTLKTDLAAFPPGVERLPDLEFWAKFDEAAPVILGALLQALSEGLRRYDSLDPKGLPRLAAFAKFVIACETAFWPEGTFDRAFAESAESAAGDVLADDPIAAVLEEFMENRKEWKGTSTQLLGELEAVVRRPERDASMAYAHAQAPLRRAGKLATADEIAAATAAATVLKEAREHVRETLGVKWPKAPNALSSRLRKIGPQLRGEGIEIVWPTGHRDGRVLTITKAPKDVSKDQQGSSSSSSSSSSNDINGLEGKNWSTKNEWDRPQHRPRPLDPDFLPPEPDNTEVPAGLAASPKPNSSSAFDQRRSPELHKGRKGFEI
jgi:hypothetical protein